MMHKNDVFVLFRMNSGPCLNMMHKNVAFCTKTDGSFLLQMVNFTTTGASQHRRTGSTGWNRSWGCRTSTAARRTTSSGRGTGATTHTPLARSSRTPTQTRPQMPGQFTQIKMIIQQNMKILLLKSGLLICVAGGRWLRSGILEVFTRHPWPTPVISLCFPLYFQ